MTAMPGSDKAREPASQALAQAWAWAAFAAVLVILPLVFTSSFGLSMLSQVGIALIACLSFNLLLGQAGLLSFGHALYTGAGAYLVIHALRGAAQEGWPLPVSLLPVLGGMAGMLVALLPAWIATRRGPTAFAMITLGVGELAWAAALMFPGVFGGEAGISANRMVGARPGGISFGPPLQLYGLIALYAFACAWAMHALTRTPLGHLLRAARDNPERVSFLGHDPRQLRFQAFLLSAFFAGISGGLAALHFEIVTPDALAMHRSGALLLFTVLGGTAVFFGPMIGAVLMVLAYGVLSEWTQAWHLYLGLAFLVVVLWVPGGLGSLVTALGPWRSGRAWRAQAGSLVPLAVAALAGFAGTAALIEMTYHLKLAAALGPGIDLGGLVLQVDRPTYWVACAVLAAGGWGAFAWMWRRLRPPGRAAGLASPGTRASGASAP